MKEFIEKLIGRLEELKSNKGFGGTIQQMYADDKIDKAIEIVNQLAEEYNNGWIPCSERLPKCENGCETKALMFQMKETGSIKCGYYGEGGFYRDKYFRTYTNNTDGYDARDVIAWQPLPAPFQKGE